MRLVIISDTHRMHELVNLPPGDVLIHAGDACSWGRPNEMIGFASWFEQQEHEHKIFVAGNHDKCMQNFDGYFSPESGVHYLQDREVVIDGVKFYGSPWTPIFSSWAFMLEPKELHRKWQQIPDDTDVLITHGPPQGIMDKTYEGLDVGCMWLAQRVLEVQPALHIFGHIHEGYGITGNPNVTQYVNASVVNINYQVVNSPIVIDL